MDRRGLPERGTGSSAALRSPSPFPDPPRARSGFRWIVAVYRKGGQAPPLRFGARPRFLTRHGHTGTALERFRLIVAVCRKWGQAPPLRFGASPHFLTLVMRAGSALAVFDGPGQGLDLVLKGVEHRLAGAEVDRSDVSPAVDD